MVIDGHTHVHADRDGLGKQYDARLEHLLHAMDEAHVAKALIMAEAVNVPYIKRIDNRFVADCCARHPDRLIGFASVHPLEKNAPSELAHAIQDLGLIGLKLHPRFQGVSADDPRCVELVRMAADFGVPIAVDALLWKPTPLRLQLPINIDGLCKQVPEARIIMNHAGGFHFLDTLAVAVANEHVYVELSVALPYFCGTPFEDQFLYVLHQIGSRRLIFGSDHPQKNMAQALETTRALLTKAGFNEDDLAWVLGRTLRSLLPVANRRSVCSFTDEQTNTDRRRGA